MSQGNGSKKLGDLFTFKNGRSFKKTEWSESGLPIIRIQNLNDRTKPFNRFEGEYDPAIEIQSGDLLFSWSGTVGSSFGPHIWDRETGVLNQHIYKIGFKEDTDPDYAYYALLETTAEIEQRVRGAVGLVHVTKTDLKEFEIPHPPKAEQKRIVSILDEAFSAIGKAKENAEKNLLSARELFESYLNRVFTQQGPDWQEKALPDISENLDRQRKPITKSKREPGDIPYYGASGVVDHVKDFLFDEPLLLVSEDGGNLIARTRPIAFSIKGKTWVNNHAHVLRFPELQLQQLVAFYLNSISIEPWVRGLDQKKLNQTNLNSIPILVPPREQRAEIVREFELVQDKTETCRKLYTQKLANLDELKQSLLQKAFTGQLTSCRFAVSS